MFKFLLSITWAGLAVLFSGKATAQVQIIQIENGTSASLETRRDGEWIQWNGFTPGYRMGIDTDFSVASRWTPDDLNGYDGLQITKISFFPLEPEPTYTLKIWVDSDLKPQEVYSQQIHKITAGQWNYVKLDTPFTINAADGVWFGYKISNPTGTPVGCDVGPQVAGKGNMLLLYTLWYELTEISESLNYNWLLAAFVTEGSTLVDILSDVSFSVYPNPASNMVNIFAEEMIQEVNLVDMAGKIIYSGNVQDNNHQINLSSYSNGIYFLQMITSEGVTTQKLQISK